MQNRTESSPVVWQEAIRILSERLQPFAIASAIADTNSNLLHLDPQAEFLKNSAADLKQHLTEISATRTWKDASGAVVAATPLVYRGRTESILILTAQDDITESVLSAHAAAAVQIFQDQKRVADLEGDVTALSGHLADTYEELSLIYHISSGMRVNRSPADFFQQACTEVLQVMSLRGIAVVMDSRHVPDNAPVVFGDVSLSEEELEKIGSAAMATIRQRDAVVIWNNLSGTPIPWANGQLQCLAAAPLQRQDRMLGCLIAFDKQAGEFDSVDAKLLNSIANECAVYTENAMLFDDAHGLMMGLLHSLTSAVDAKDAYTCGHSERVALLSRELAKRINLSDEQVERVYMAGLLHDVGKIGVPEYVLQKTGKLTNEEFLLMKKHPEIGGKILKNIKQLQDLLPGVLHHHERYDGKGYPAGLAGQNIPLFGRLLCLGDSFDAMTSNRTYRKAMPIEVALAEIRRAAGTQFDPELAEVFIGFGADALEKILRQHQQSAGRLLELQENVRHAA